MNPSDSRTRTPHPNVVIIYADDMGYGDVACYNPDRGKIPTPCMDRLAEQGMRFTDAHSSSAVCTPSRYTILTGRYHWRTHLQSGVLNGMGEPLISNDRLTMAGMLKGAGYATACIGKWHLGMTMPDPITGGKIKDGPTAVGFDHFFGISGSLDMAPFAFIEDDRFAEEPTTEKTLLIPLGEPRTGPAAPSFESVDVLPTITRKSLEWIEAQKDNPFLLYMPLNSPHTPLAPTREWKGRSGLGDYADFVMQTDAAVGEIMDALEEYGIADNTMVILSSDNGCAPYVGTKVSDDPRDSCGDRMDEVKDLEAEGHYPSGPLRGYKSDVWEGGHRIPFIVRWPGVARAGAVCEQLVHQADIMATVADFIGIEIPGDAAEDSVSFMPLMNDETTPVRDHLVSASIRGLPSVRVGTWQYAPGNWSGGWSSMEDDSQPVQLYNLAEDIGSQTNLADQQPERVDQMQALLDSLVDRGRSTPGPDLENDVDVVRYPRTNSE